MPLERGSNGLGSPNPDAEIRTSRATPFSKSLPEPDDIPNFRIEANRRVRQREWFNRGERPRRVPLKAYPSLEFITKLGR